MDPETTTLKPSNRNRFSLVLHLGSSSNAGPPANTINVKRSMPNMGEAYLASPVDIQPHEQVVSAAISPNQDRSSGILSTSFNPTTIQAATENTILPQQKRTTFRKTWMPKVNPRARKAYLRSQIRYREGQLAYWQALRVKVDVGARRTLLVEY